MFDFKGFSLSRQALLVKRVTPIIIACLAALCVLPFLQYFSYQMDWYPVWGLKLYAVVFLLIVLYIYYRIFRSVERSFFYFNCAVLLLTPLLILVVGYIDSLVFDGYPFDGPFQSYNALRRIDNGQIIGLDTQYFHGILIPYLNYPLYSLFGGNLFASEFSRITINALIYFVYFFCFYKLFHHNKKLVFALFFIYLFVSESQLLMTGTHSFIVSVHLNLLRTILPLVIFVFLIRAELPVRNKVLVTACLTVLAYYMGNEHGIYSFLALVFYWAIYQGNIRTKFINMGLYVGAVAVLLIGSHYAFLGGINNLKFMSDITQDQVWYFGNFPNDFYSSFGSFIGGDANLARRALASLLYVALLTVLAIYFLCSKYVKAIFSKKELNASIFFVIYGGLGMLSLLGYLGAHYLDSLLRSYLIIILLILSKVLIVKGSSTNNEVWMRKILFSRFLAISTPLVLCLLMIQIFPYQRVLDKVNTINTGRAHFDADLGVYPSLGLVNNVDFSHHTNLLAFKNAVEENKSNFFHNIMLTSELSINGYKNITTIESAAEIPSWVKVGDLVEIELNNKDLSSYTIQTNVLGLEGRRITVRKMNTSKGIISAVRFIKRIASHISKAPENCRHTSPIGDGSLFYNGINVKDNQIKINPECYPFYVSGMVLNFKNSSTHKIERISDSGVITLAKSPKQLSYFDGYPYYFEIIEYQDTFPYSSQNFAAKEVASESSVRLTKDLKDVDKLYNLRTGLEVSVMQKGLKVFGDFSNDADYGLHNTYVSSPQELDYTLQSRKGLSLWSQYPGLIEGKYNLFKCSNIDYEIHALGPRLRSQYFRGFTECKPDILQLMSPNIAEQSKFYSWWLINSFWELYAEIYDNYEPASQSLYSTFWKKSNTSSKRETINTFDEYDIWFDSSGERLLTVEVEINIKPSLLTKLPVIGKTNRHYITVTGGNRGGMIAVPPYRKSMLIPILSSGDRVTLDKQSITPFGIDEEFDFKIKSVLEHEFNVEKINYMFGYKS